MEYWDIYDRDKKPTGRTMKRNDWCLKAGEYHLTVLGVVARPDHKFLITKRVMTKAWAPGCWEVSGGAAQAGEMHGMPTAVICLLTNVKIRAREITISSMYIALSWTLKTKICTCRKQRQMAICLQLWRRSKLLQQRINSFIMTVSNRPLNSDKAVA